MPCNLGKNRAPLRVIEVGGLTALFTAEPIRHP
jgi:hypothetical protein